MQIRFFHMTGDRPDCPIDPAHTIHRHGHYDRYGDCHCPEGVGALVRIFRFLCPPCGHTISVLPEDMLPYRPISAPKVQEHFDAKTSDVPPPPATEKESGCLKRAWERFTRRTTALAATLGQMMQLVFPEPKLTWLQLRRWGNLSDILLLLGRPFNTSLLLDYRCLRPWCRKPD